MVYSRSLQVRWTDCDPNWHMRGSAYADACTDVRVGFLSDEGYPLEELGRIGVMPVLLREEVDYLREARLGEVLEVSLRLAGLSPEGSRWKLRHELAKAGGGLAARLLLHGGWLDMRTRKLVAPPRALLDVLVRLDKTPDFESLLDVVQPPPR